MGIFIVKLKVRRSGEDYIQVIPFASESRAIEKFDQVLEIARMFSDDSFSESKLTDKIIRHYQSKFVSIKLFKLKEGEAEKF